MRLVGVLLAGVLVLLTGAPAVGHAGLVSTDPVDGSTVAALPEQLTLTFNEPVRLPGAHAVSGVAADGSVWAVAAVARDKQVLVVPLDDPGTGTLALSWRVVADDGHELSGTLRFTVEGAGATAVPAVPADAATSVDLATWVARGTVGLGLVALAVAAVVGAAGRAALWYAAFAAAALLAPLERLRSEGRGLGGLADWLTWLDGFTEGHSLLLLGAVVLATLLLPARRPLVAGLVGAGVVLVLTVALG